MKTLTLLALLIAGPAFSAGHGPSYGVPPSGAGENITPSTVVTTTLTVTGTSVGCISAGLLTIDCANTRIGIGDATPNDELDVISNVPPLGYVVGVSSQADVIEGGIFAILGNGNVGINDNAPAALFEITSSTKPTGYVLDISSQTGPVASIFGVTGAGHVVSSGTTPGIVCSAGSPVMLANSNDQSGSFTAGTAATNCTVTFTSAWSKVPVCIAVTNAATPVALSSTPGTSSVVFTALGALTGDTLYYFCWGAP